MIRLDRVQQGFGDIFDPFFGSGTEVYWGYWEPTGNQLPGNLVIFRITSGPTPTDITRARSVVYNLPISATFDFTAVSDNELFQFVINQHLYSYVVQPAETPTQVRDNFAAELNTNPFDEFTASPQGASEIVFTPKADQYIWGLSRSANITLVDSVFDPNPSEVTYGILQMTITVDVFSNQRSLYAGALNIVQRIVTALQRPDTSRRFYLEYGMALQERLQAIPLYELAGPNWESRAAVDVPFRSLSVDVIAPTTNIVSINMGIELIKPTGNTLTSTLDV